MLKTKLTKRHFQFLADLINQCALAQEKMYKSNIPYTGTMRHVGVVLNVNPYPVVGVRESVERIHFTVLNKLANKEFHNQFHERNSYIKELAIELEAQNPRFVASEFKKACMKGV